MKRTRQCEFKGHSKNNTIYICTYSNCEQDSKWVCVDCMQIHNHEQPNLNHLKKQQQFLDFISHIQDNNNEDKKLIQTCINELEYLMESIQNLISDLTSIMENQNFKEIEQIIDITRNDFFMLNNITIAKIINLNNYQYKQNLSEDFLKQLIKFNYDIQYQRKNVIMKQENNLDNKIVETIEQLSYETHFNYQPDSYLWTSQISQDEKYLVVGDEDRNIQVYDIITKQIIKSIKIDNKVGICIFTNNSKYLLCGDQVGYLFCYDTNNNFNQKYKKQIHLGWIYDILPIDDDQIITCSYDKSIIITNVKQESQLLLIKDAHNRNIYAIEYDQQNDAIISGSEDKSIKFFSRTDGKLQFEQQNAHNKHVCQIQVVSHKNNILLSSGLYDIILWQINFDKKQLNKLQVLNEKHFNFKFVQNKSRIILIQSGVLQILDENLNLQQFIYHNVDQISYVIIEQDN